MSREKITQLEHANRQLETEIQQKQAEIVGNRAQIRSLQAALEEQSSFEQMEKLRQLCASSREINIAQFQVTHGWATPGRARLSFQRSHPLIEGEIEPDRTGKLKLIIRVRKDVQTAPYAIKTKTVTDHEHAKKVAPKMAYETLLSALQKQAERYV